MLLLFAVAGLYAVFGELQDAATILVVIVAVAAVEAANEARARRAIASLARLAVPEAVALRDGASRVLPAAELVTGDLVLLDAGRRVPADLRLLSSEALRIDESTLTGESMPLSKQADAVLAGETALGDRVNLAFAGTMVTAGQGRGVAVATGPATELGRIAGLAASARPPQTPLQRHMRRLAGWLLWVAAGFSLAIPVLSVTVAGRPWRESLLEGLTLAFATIPEELPILITVALGLGARRLAREGAITRRLHAAETLGSVSVICADKTGTLTENRVRVTEVDAPGDPSRLLAAAALASPGEDAIDAALRAAAVEARVPDAGGRVVATFPFDPARRRVSVVYERGPERWLAVKGAPEAVIAIGRVGDARDVLARNAEAMAGRGLRVIAIAERRLPAGVAVPDAQEAEAGLTLLGLAGLEDPPRSEAPGAVRALRGAGVRVVMLTGDHPATARAIADRVGIEPADVFARIDPEQKLRIVAALEEAGEVVAVTGDGVNDAPALRRAAIGVAMGKRGTDVAREAADLVLADDDFATIAVAVRAGRTLFENLRKAVRYYLAVKVALVTACLCAVLFRRALPFAPIQIIVLELFMDLGASTTFVAEPAEADVMARPPRDPRRPFMDRSMVLGILGGGVSLAAAVLLSYAWALGQGLGLEAARGAAFAAWILGHLVLAAHMRSEREPLLRAGLRPTIPFVLWAMAALGLLAAAQVVPSLSRRLSLAPLPLGAWALALGSALVFPSWWEAWKWIDLKRGRHAILVSGKNSYWR